VDQATSLINKIFLSGFPLIFNSTIRLILLNNSNPTSIKKQSAVLSYLSNKYGYRCYFSFLVDGGFILKLVEDNYIIVLSYYRGNKGGVFLGYIKVLLNGYKILRLIEGVNSLNDYFNSIHINYKDQTKIYKIIK
jgi:hypothetical protein